jgi:putative transposase
MITYKRHRFPPEIISYAVWLFYRFNLSHRDIEDLLAQRGISVSYELVRCWCLKFDQKYAKRLRKKHHVFGDTFFVDEVFIRIGGKQHYLWRAVDQDGEVVDVLLQTRRNTSAAMRFFKRILKSAGSSPHRIVTDKLRSYGAAQREMRGAWEHDT